MDSCEDCGEIHHPEDMLTPDADEWPEVAGMVYCRFCWEHIENEIINERWSSGGPWLFGLTPM